MELLNKSKYALLAMLALAAQYGSRKPLQTQQIAAQHQISDRYLDDLLAQLKQGNLIRSERGVKGGYRLAREPQEITVLDVIHCVEDRNSQPSRGHRTETVARGAIFEIWRERAEAADLVLQQHTLRDLQDLLEKKNAQQRQNLMYYI